MKPDTDLRGDKQAAAGLIAIFGVIVVLILLVIFVAWIVTR